MVAGEAGWERLPGRARDFLRREGDGALADVAQTGLDPDGLRRITAPVTILTGTASEPVYAPLADTLAARIPGARHVALEGAVHTSPITHPAPIAAAIRAFLELSA
jgi:pimeloyl-ACP methyl ester carboxylesterase